MSLFSSLRKNKQEPASDDSVFLSRAEEDSKAVRSRSRRRQGKQEDAAADPELPEKKRARRRLVGAVALVLAAVVGLPMILDSEPKPLADDIAIQIPSKDKVSSMPAPQSAATEAEVATTAALDPEEEFIDPAPEQLDSVAGTAPEKKAAQPEPAAKAETAPVARSEAKPQTKTVTDKPAEQVSEAQRALALLEGKPDPKKTEAKPAKYAIQVAALASKDKIAELQARLAGAGIKSYTQKVATQAGERTRIRVGPFSSKEEAEKMRARIVKLGLNGTLVPA